MPTKDDYFEAKGPADAGFKGVGQGATTPLNYGATFRGRRIGVLASQGLDPPIIPGKEWGGVVGRSAERTGVAGSSRRFPGVYGQTQPAPLVPAGIAAGVFGVADTQAGVIGFSRTGEGVQGASYTGVAVNASSFDLPAVYAYSGAQSGIVGVVNTQGPTVPNLPIAGVIGTADALPGVIGASNSSAGVYGYSANNEGIVGRTENPAASLAGYFIGDVRITGRLTATTKNAVVAFPDGSSRLLHCMESPEHWFEDFGAARLKRGRAVVKLDTTFAKAIKRGDYHVFLTPLGDCGGLRVWRERGTSFEVREIGDGKSNVAFSYRIVGRRRDIKRHRRFAKVDLPPPPRVSQSRPPRKPTEAAFRTFIATLEDRRRKQKKMARRVRTPAKDLSSADQLGNTESGR